MSNIKLLAKKLYSQKEVREELFYFSRHRELMIRTTGGKVIRPAVIQFSNDFNFLKDHGMVSIHGSVDKYKPETVSEVNDEDLLGRDIVIDIDVKQVPKDIGFENVVDFAAELVYKLYDNIIRRLRSRGTYIKFSGNRGFHIIIPYEEIPTTMLGLDSTEYALIFHRSILLLFKYATYSIVSSYLNVSKELLSIDDIVDIDLQLASPRHMIRAPYSLHEKTGLASIIVYPSDLKQFDISMAKPPVEVTPIPREYTPNNEFIEDFAVIGFIMSYAENKLEERFAEFSLHRYRRIMGGSIKRTRKYKKIIKNIEEIYPPCVRKMLEGLEDGRKRSLFHLVTFFRNTGVSMDEAFQKLTEWNKRNKEPLSQRLIEYAVQYHYDKKRKYLPYSCQRIREEFGDLICKPDKYCKLYQVKHPLSYFYKRLREVLSENGGEKEKRN